MAGSKRERELARAKYERQQAKRAADQARRRRRLQVVTAVVVGALVVVGVVALSKWTSSSGKANAAATTTPTASVSPSSSPIPTDGSPVSCTYTPQGVAAKTVTPPSTTAPTRPATSNVRIVLNGKPVTVQLLRSKAPCTVNSFTHLAAAGYYNGTPCHRLTKGALAVLQCGDPKGTGAGGPGYVFPDENLTGATYPAGTVAMANAGPGTNGSQFFIVYANTTLPPSYTPFGTVVSGLPVVKAIAAKGIAGGGTDGAPAKKVVIDRIVPAG